MARLSEVDTLRLALKHERAAHAKLRAQLAAQELDAELADVRARYQLAPDDTIALPSGEIKRAAEAAEGEAK